MKNPEAGNKERLLHIKKACSKIREYTKDHTRKTFLSDKLTQDAVIYQLIITGEAIIHVDNAILEKYDYPWYKVRAFRNYAAHEYFNLKDWTVWEIVEKHLGELEKVILVILKKEFNVSI